jgi:hypothetical protein
MRTCNTCKWCSVNRSWVARVLYEYGPGSSTTWSCENPQVVVAERCRDRDLTTRDRVEGEQEHPPVGCYAERRRRCRVYELDTVDHGPCGADGALHELCAPRGRRQELASPGEGQVKKGGVNVRPTTPPPPPPKGQG